MWGYRYQKSLANWLTKFPTSSCYLFIQKKSNYWNTSFILKWKYIKESCKIANCFNNYFHSFGKNVANKIKSDPNFKPPQLLHISNSVFLSATNEKERLIMNKLDTKKEARIRSTNCWIIQKYCLVKWETNVMDTNQKFQVQNIFIDTEPCKDTTNF